MRVLVTGGTGFLGSFVVSRLRRRGHRVTVFSRSESPELRRRYRGVRWVHGDITDRAALERAFPVDVVIHLAARLGGRGAGLHESNVRGTENVVALCERHRVRQLIFMSSTAAVGDVPVVHEHAVRKPLTAYGKSKRDAEDRVMAALVPWTIVRAPVIIGPTPTWRSIFRAAQKRYPLIGSGRNHFHAVYVDDVAALISAAAGNKKATGRILHVATSDTPTYAEFYRILCDVLGVPMTERRIPVVAARTLAAVHGTSARIRGRQPHPVLNREIIDRLTRDRVVDASGTHRLLGFRARYTTRQALAATAAAFKKAGAL